MLIVSQVRSSIENVLGTCDDSVFYDKVNEAIEILANFGHWEPFIGFMDICTHGCNVTLPDDVEVPLMINVGGHPAQYRNKWFEFHLNGPGSECCNGSCSWSWDDKGDFPTYRELNSPSRLAAYPEVDEDKSANVRIYGYDEHDKWLMEDNGTGIMTDGLSLPLFNKSGYGLPSSIRTKRITRVTKPETKGFVKLVALDNDGVQLGYYRPYETVPQYRRIVVSGNGCNALSNCSTWNTWVRMRYRRKFYKVSTDQDPIPLNSLTALKLACMAVFKYEKNLFDEYEKYLSLAEQALMREEKTRAGPNQIKIQFEPNFIGTPYENMI